MRLSPLRRILRILMPGAPSPEPAPRAARTSAQGPEAAPRRTPRPARSHALRRSYDLVLIQDVSSSLLKSPPSSGRSSATDMAALSERPASTMGRDRAYGTTPGHACRRQRPTGARPGKTRGADGLPITPMPLTRYELRAYTARTHSGHTSGFAPHAGWTKAYISSPSPALRSP